MLLRRFVPGNPKGQPRPRAFARKIGGSVVARVYDAGTAEGWKGAVALAFRGAGRPLAGPIRLSIEFLFPRPARLMRKSDASGALPYEAKPDVDNAAKAVMDALQGIGLLRDDSQITDLWVRKWYHAKDGIPGALVTIQEHADSVPAWLSMVGKESERVVRAFTVGEAVAAVGGTIETVEASRIFGAEE